MAVQGRQPGGGPRPRLAGADLGSRVLADRRGKVVAGPGHAFGQLAGQVDGSVGCRVSGVSGGQQGELVSWPSSQQRRNGTPQRPEGPTRHPPTVEPKGDCEAGADGAPGQNFAVKVMAIRFTDRTFFTNRSAPISA
jgi:hypothetical protein